MNRISSLLSSWWLALALAVAAAFCASEGAAQDAPPDADAVAARLLVHHVEDLPATWPTSTLPPLRWLATHHRMAVVRMRALQALAGDRSPETRALLMRVIRDERASASLRASAVMGSRGLRLDGALRAALEAAAATHPSLREEVTRRLAPLPAR